jgi:hypothetical protein
LLTIVAKCASRANYNETVARKNKPIGAPFCCNLVTRDSTEAAADAILMATLLMAGKHYYLAIIYSERQSV